MWLSMTGWHFFQFVYTLLLILGQGVSGQGLSNDIDRPLLQGNKFLNSNTFNVYISSRKNVSREYIYIYIYIYMAEEEETIYILVEATINIFHPYSIFVALFDSSVSHLQFFWRSVDLKINNVFLPGWWDFSRNRFSVVVED